MGHALGTEDERRQARNGERERPCFLPFRMGPIRDAGGSREPETSRLRLRGARCIFKGGNDEPRRIVFSRCSA